MTETVTFKLTTLTRLKAIKPDDVTTSRFVELLINEGLNIYCSDKNFRKIVAKPGLNTTTVVALTYRTMLFEYRPDDITLPDFTTHIINLALDSIEQKGRKK